MLGLQAQVPSALPARWAERRLVEVEQGLLQQGRLEQGWLQQGRLEQGWLQQGLVEVDTGAERVALWALTPSQVTTSSSDGGHSCFTTTNPVVSLHAGKKRTGL